MTGGLTGVEAFSRFGRHLDWCSTVRIAGHKICDCGFVFYTTHISPAPEASEAFEAGWHARDRAARVGGQHVGSPAGYAAVPVDPAVSHDRFCCASVGCHPICSHLCGTDLHTCDGTDHAAGELAR